MDEHFSGASGVRFVNKINQSGTLDPNFLVPFTSTIAICSAVHYDEDSGLILYAFQQGSTQTLIACNSTTGQTVHTLVLPSPTGMIHCIAKIPGTDYFAIAGNLKFNYQGQSYVNIFKTSISNFQIQPIEGLTGVTPDTWNGGSRYEDVIFVNKQDCNGNYTDTLEVYVGGAFSEIGQSTGRLNIAKLIVEPDGSWVPDEDFNAGCYGVVKDLCYYNCQLVACGSFASSRSSFSTNENPIAIYTPKIVAFSDGTVNSDFIISNSGGALGGSIAWNGQIFNLVSQGWVTFMAIQNVDDGNNRWEILVGGQFISYLSRNNSPLYYRPYMARLIGMKAKIDPNFDYFLETINDTHYQISAINPTETTGCETWSLLRAQGDTPTSWDTLRTYTGSDFFDTTLVVSKWYKVVRSIKECGNTCSVSYVFIREKDHCSYENYGSTLRNLIADYIQENPAMRDTVNFTVFPNPFVNNVTVVDQLGFSQKNISVYNTLGGKMYNRNYTLNSINIDLSFLPSGVYIMVMSTGSDVLKKKIVKEQTR